ncbi:MAG TPA: hypothetical protein VFA04_06865 [Bryobacteraceae bacterium]|nr:hypothetical protein [Bryobacteraceae bacterium]
MTKLSWKGMRMRFCWFIVAAALVLASAGSAATITDFTAAAHPGAPFDISTVNSAFIWNSADVLNSTIVCSNPQGCSGPVIDFEVVGTGLSDAVPMTVSLVGTFGPIPPPPSRGRTNAVADILQIDGSVDLTLNGDPAGPNSFSQWPGRFNITIASLSVAGASGPGDFDIVGTLNLSMPTGTQLALSTGDSLQVSIFPPDIPEPPAAMLLFAGMGLIGLARLRSRLVRGSQG